MLAPDPVDDALSGTERDADLYRLCADVLVLIRDTDEAAGTARLSIDANRSIAPLAALRLALADGGARSLWVFRAPDADRFTVALDADHDAPGPHLPGFCANVTPEAALERASAGHLLTDLTDAGRRALLGAMLNAWPAMFRLTRSRSYTRLVRDVLEAAVIDPLPARPVARVGGSGAVLLQTAVSAGFGAVRAAHHVGSSGLRRLAVTWRDAPGQGARAVMSALARIDPAPGGRDLLVLSGVNGIAVRRLDAPKAVPPLLSWWRARGNPDPALREHVVAVLASGGADGRRAALEFQAATPLAARRVAGGGGMPSCVVDLAIATPAGTLVGGWLRDPSGFVEGIDLLSATGGARAVDAVWHRFPVTRPAGKDGAENPATGFVAFLPEDDAPPLLQRRFQLRLVSGAVRGLVAPPQPFDPAAARARALAAVPPAHVTDALLEDVLAPALRHLQRAVVERLEAPRAVIIGEPPARPLASLVIPLYRTLDFLRFQVAAFASDPWLTAHAEVVYVLDSPEQAEETEHLLRGLRILYDLPVTLLVMSHNGGYAPASNAGARAARGAVLALVNSDVIPTAPGWLPRLAGLLGGPHRIGAVGPKLLFEDGSLQHAGMYFARGAGGGWLNHHFHKGLPGGYGPGNVERFVPAVTGACLVTPRELFQRVGGFTEDYVIGDYEDSDLCLKIREAGSEIAYCPRAALYHLERRSIRQSADYMRGAASRYNSWLHAQRWDAVMAALMEPAEPVAEIEGRAVA